MIRTTTNGVLHGYQFNLQRSSYTLNKARDMVLTGRRFNSFAEDPALAAHSFKLRTSLLQLDSQYTVSQSVVRKYEIAWSTMDSVSTSLKTAKDAILRASNPPTAGGRKALGQQLSQLAEGIVKSMNNKYGDNFVFAGADGLNMPFELENGKLTYRGLDVNAAPGSDEYNKLQDLLKNEKKFADIGLGLEEHTDGSLNETSAFDTALHGVTFLGHGQDADGDPQNIVCMIDRMGTILQNCDADGNFASDADKQEFQRLSEKFEPAMSTFSAKYTELDARANFLKENHKQLQQTSYNMQEQIQELEKVDPADAIMAYSWAQYSYNAALKVGNSILSQSLMDYING